MNKSSIEYLTHCWNFYTGCRNQEIGICNLPCWAWGLAHRFGRSFEPKFQFGAFTQPMPKKTARIGVCFTGDLFGDWVLPEERTNPDQPDVTFRDRVIHRIMLYPQHQFFFLTKCPWNLKKWGEFPDNAYVGVTCLNAQQVWLAVERLKEVKAKHKWLSLEPLQGDIFAPSWELNKHLVGIDWVVIGAQTHPIILPKIEWVKEIAEACGRANIRVFLKDNLQPVFWVNGCKDHVFFPAWATARGVYRQELPV